MKRLFTLVLSALVLSVCAFASPEAVDNAVEVDLAEFYSDAELMATYGDLTYSVSNGKVTITDCSTSVTSVTIPSTINGYPVTSIGDRAFWNCSSLASIEIPDSVTSIGYGAFYKCRSLEKVTVLSRDVIFEWRVFDGCPNLTIYGYTGSTSETYAAEYDIPFIDLDSIPPYTLGDLGGDGEIDASDAILLLQHSMFPELYPLDYAGDVDFTGDGEVDMNDAILLLQHSMFPDLYPID